MAPIRPTKTVARPFLARFKSALWMLQTTAFVPANILDLGRFHPDFTVVSWYKVFGHPTGVGSLIARRDALARLRRPWFSGGTIRAASAQAQWHDLADDEAAFEDGTVNFLSIPDVTAGVEWIERVGMARVHAHVADLTRQLLMGLGELRHSDGSPLVRVYGPGAEATARGGTVALNLLDAAGRVVDERIVTRDSAARGISLRTGCFCNPGAGEVAFGLPLGRLRSAAGRRSTSMDETLTLLGLPSAGAVRISVGRRPSPGISRRSCGSRRRPTRIRCQTPRGWRRAWAARGFVWIPPGPRHLARLARARLRSRGRAPWHRGLVRGEPNGTPWTAANGDGPRPAGPGSKARPKSWSGDGISSHGGRGLTLGSPDRW